jgi:hypothetical protein
MGLESVFRQIAESISREADLAVRGGAAEMHEYMVYRAPEDTGRLENNFIITRDAPASFSTPGPSNKQAAIEGQHERIARVGAGDVIFFTNSVTYAPPFETGEKRPRAGGSSAGMMSNAIFRFDVGAQYAVKRGEWR